MNKTLVRILAVVLALLMAGSILFSALSSLKACAAATLSQTQLDALRFLREDLQTDQNEIASRINSLEYEQYSPLEKKEVLDQQVELAQAEVDNITAQIRVYQQYILDLNAEINECREAEQQQMDAYRARIRAMEENGVISYFAVLADATSLMDFFYRIDFITEMIDCDNLVQEEMEAARARTAETEARLEQALVDQSTILSELETYKAIVLQRVEEASAVIREVEEDVADHREDYEGIVAAQLEVQKRVDDMIAEIARQEAASNRQEFINPTRSYIWPSSNSRVVTQQFGTRLDPEFGYYVTHYGIDIAAAYGTDVLAADSGTIVIADYDPAYGYYIMLSHGHGRATIYAQLSKINVSVGPYPVLLISLAERFGLEKAERIMMQGMEIAASLVADGKANSMGEIGRPHFPVDDVRIMDASNRILLRGMELAHEVDCPVIIHCESEDYTDSSLASMAKEAGLDPGKVVKHSSPPWVTLEETHGVMPSIPASRSLIREAISKSDRFMMETDFIDDPQKPNAIMAVTSVPKRVKGLFQSGELTEEQICRICGDIPDSLYRR